MFEWTLPLWGEALVFLAAAGVIGLAGAKAAKYADRLADRTGLGEAVTGTLFLGFLTALPGLTASVIAALNGHPGLAVHNAMGGIAIQTAALAIADIAYPKANLEHAAASAPNLIQTATLVLLLTLPMVGMTGPNVTVGHIHPATLLLIVATIVGIVLAWRTRRDPMWKPTLTEETVEDKPAPENQRLSLTRLISQLFVSALLTGLAGAAVAEAGSNTLEQTELSDAVVGGLFMAIATSLPELVTSVAAVRRGALTLAVSNVVGGNFFDVLFVAAADIVYLQGSLYHGEEIGYDDLFLTCVTILMNVILLVGLVYRQKRGPGNIGLESVLILLVYVAGFLTLTLAM